MDPTIQPILSPQVLSGIKNALSCVVIGTIASTGVYGVTVLQAYIYVRSSSRDSTHMRSFVVFLFILDTAAMLLTLNGFYKDVIIDFGDPSLLLHMPLTLAFQDMITVVIRALTQCFFAHRLWALSERNVALVSSIVILAFCSLGPAMAISVHMYLDNYTFSFSSLKIRMLAGFANGLSAICDILITAALCYYLRSKRTGFKRTDSMIHRLIVYAVNRGALTAICQAGEMITTVALPGRFLFIPFALLNGKLYCNTLLATLNAQKSMRDDCGDSNIVELGTQFLDRLNAPTSRNGNYRGTAGRLDSASNSIPTFVMDLSVSKNMDVEQTAPSVSDHTLHAKE